MTRRAAVTRAEIGRVLDELQGSEALMSAYDELVARCIDAYWADAEGDLEFDIKAVLAEVFRTLKNVTPEMKETMANHIIEKDDWLAMLRASPLNPKAN